VAVALALGAALGLVFSLAMLRSDPKLAADDGDGVERAFVPSAPPVVAAEPTRADPQFDSGTATKPAAESAIAEPRTPPKAPVAAATQPKPVPKRAEPDELRTPRAAVKPTPDELLDRRR
jgi:hypothetical protein